MEIFKSKHIGCYGVVYNDEGEVLLIKKARGAYKGQFDLPGGGIEYGETAEETLMFIHTWDITRYDLYEILEILAITVKRIIKEKEANIEITNNSNIIIMSKYLNN